MRLLDLFKIKTEREKGYAWAKVVLAGEPSKLDFKYCQKIMGDSTDEFAVGANDYINEISVRVRLMATCTKEQAGGV